MYIYNSMIYVVLYPKVNKTNKAAEVFEMQSYSNGFNENKYTPIFDLLTW